MNSIPRQNSTLYPSPFEERKKSFSPSLFPVNGKKVGFGIREISTFPFPFPLPGAAPVVAVVKEEEKKGERKCGFSNTTHFPFRMGHFSD